MRRRRSFYDRSDITVVSVLLEGVSKDAITLSNMIIGSYGANPNGSLTHASCSTNQESKKTQVGIYGTNLEKWTTKFKLADEYGIEWPILTNPGNDSADFPTMVLDWNGVIGEGSYQHAEIILPNNIDNEPRFTYSIAVDGKTFDKEAKLIADVPTGIDGQPNRFRNKVIKLSIKCLNEEGKQMRNEVLYGYDWFQYDLITKAEMDQKVGGTLEEKLGDELQIPEIDGYNYNKLRTLQEDLKGLYVNGAIEMDETWKINEDKELPVLEKEILIYYSEEGTEPEVPGEDDDESEAEIYKINLEETKFESEEELTVEAFGKGLTKENVDLKLTKENDEVVDSNFEIVGVIDTRVSFKGNLPVNNGKEDKKYIISVVDKKTGKGMNKVVTIKPVKVEDEVVITEISSLMPNAGKATKTFPIEIKGENIFENKLDIKFLKDGKDTNIKYYLQNPSSDGTSIMLLLNLDENTTGNEIEYKVIVNGTEFEFMQKNK